MPEQAQIIRWEHPPPPAPRGRLGGRRASESRRNPSTSHPGSRYVSVAAELRSRRGEYAVIKEGQAASGLGSLVSLGRLHCFQPAGDYEGTTRRNGLVTVYARYLGDGDA